MGEARQVHVFFNDACAAGNPYHFLLKRALGAPGVNVRVSGADPSTLIWRDVRRAEKAAAGSHAGGAGGSSGARGRIDVVHIHWLPQPMVAPGLGKTILKSSAFIAQLALLRLSGKRLVWTAHDLKNHENTHAWFDRRASRAVARLCHRVIAHCEAAREDLGAHFGSWILPRVRVVPHGSYEDFYGPTKDRAQARAELGLPPDARVLVFLGNIRPYKGVNELVERFRRIHGDRLRLVIAGRAWDEDVNRQVRDRIGDDARIVYRPGFVPVEQVSTYMSACDAAVFPYRDILTSGAVLLAMTFGRACVAVRKACIKETLDAQGSYLYEPGDPDGLEQAMRRACDAPMTELEALGRHNLALAAALGWPTIAQRTRRVYDELLTSGASNPAPHAAPSSPAREART